MDMVITLTVVMVSRMYTYVQTYQMVYINGIQFFVYKLYLKKTIFENLFNGVERHVQRVHSSFEFFKPMGACVCSQSRL